MITKKDVNTFSVLFRLEQALDIRNSNISYLTENCTKTSHRENGIVTELLPEAQVKMVTLQDEKKELEDIIATIKDEFNEDQKEGYAHFCDIQLSPEKRGLYFYFIRFVATLIEYAFYLLVILGLIHISLWVLTSVFSLMISGLIALGQ